MAMSIQADEFVGWPVYMSIDSWPTAEVTENTTSDKVTHRTVHTNCSF